MRNLKMKKNVKKYLITAKTQLIFSLVAFSITLVSFSTPSAKANEIKTLQLDKAKIPVELSQIPFHKIFNLSNSKNELNLKTNKYDLIIIDFWASWCTPCLESIPYYNSLIAKSKKKILFIPISIDSTEKMAVNFKKKLKNITVELFWDKDKVLKPYFSIEVLPYMFVYDTNLKFVKEYRGFDLDKKKATYENLFL